METTTRLTLAEFIAANQVRMTAKPCDRNPHMENSANMDHWKCTIVAGRSRMTVYFSKGYGHHGAEPELPEVLDCLASDATAADDSFEDFCANCGYDTDSRKAEKTYKTIQKQAVKLTALLGDSAYNTLLWNTERE